VNVKEIDDDFTSIYNVSNGFQNCSNSVVIFVFHFLFIMLDNAIMLIFIIDSIEINNITIRKR
jgi:hypothetical protein